MKTKEFIEKVEDLGFYVSKDMHKVGVHSRDKHVVMTVQMKHRGCVDTNWLGFRHISDWSTKQKLLDLAVEFALTPLEQREETKKCYLQLPSYMDKRQSYLNYDIENKTFGFSDKFEIGTFQTQFTQDEINDLPNQDFIKALIKEEVE